MSYVAQLEAHLDATLEQRDRAIQARRLADNPDFRSLILKAFCRDEAARYVQESADPALNAEQRADALAMAQASGHLRRFLSFQIQLGDTAGANIPDIEVALAQARAEESAQ